MATERLAEMEELGSEAEEDFMESSPQKDSDVDFRIKQKLEL